MKANFEGLILGAAVGHALDMPAEGLTSQRIGRGMASDDTDPLVMVVECMQRYPGEVATFQRVLAWRVRWWLAELPPSTGMATVRACIKLWLGFPPSKSGVFPAWDGPAMRSALIGAFFASDYGRRPSYVRASTRLTHADPKAETAARAIAEAAAFAVHGGDVSRALLPCLYTLSADAAWYHTLAHIEQALAAREEVADFVKRLGFTRVVSSYAYHTVAVALYAWLRHREDYRQGLEAVRNCGGNIDAVGAITGALLGLSNGRDGVPREWLDGMADWPSSVPRLLELAKCF